MGKLTQDGQEARLGECNGPAEKLRVARPVKQAEGLIELVLHVAVHRRERAPRKRHSLRSVGRCRRVGRQPVESCQSSAFSRAGALWRLSAESPVRGDERSEAAQDKAFQAG